METFLLLVLFVLLVSGIIWFIRKIEATNCEHDDCIVHCKFKTQDAIQVEGKPIEITVETKAIGVDFNAIRPGTTPVAVKEQLAPAKKPRKQRNPQQSQPVQPVQKAQPAKATAKPAARTAKPARPKKPSN